MKKALMIAVVWLFSLLFVGTNAVIADLASSRASVSESVVCSPVAAIDSTQTRKKARVREKLVGYSIIEVVGFKNKVGENLDEVVISDLEQMVVERINESKLFDSRLVTAPEFPLKDPSDDTTLTLQGTSSEDDAGTLLLFTEIITFNKGSRTRRWVLGGGSGRAELRGNCYLLDKRTGEQLYHFQTFGESNWGVLGGGSDKTLKGFSGRLVDFLKGKY